jgi:hypothetical protein
MHQAAGTDRAQPVIEMRTITPRVQWLISCGLFAMLLVALLFGALLQPA